MSIELDKDTTRAAQASLERYCADALDEPIGSLAAAGLLAFFLEEIGPCIYNKAVRDVQARLQQRVMEVDFEVNEEEFGYWKNSRRR